MSEATKIAREISRLTAENNEILDQFVKILPSTAKLVGHMKLFCLTIDEDQLLYHYDNALAALAAIEYELSPSDAIAVGLALTRAHAFEKHRLSLQPQPTLSLH